MHPAIIFRATTICIQKRVPKTIIWHVSAPTAWESLSFVHENIRFILLDSQEVPEDLTHGYISTNQLAWAERELKRARDYNQEIFIFSHQLPFPSVEFQGIGSRVANSAEVLEITAPFDRQILAFFCGHLHLNRVFREQGMLCIVSLWHYLLSDDVATGPGISRQS